MMLSVAWASRPRLWPDPVNGRGRAARLHRAVRGLAAGFAAAIVVLGLVLAPASFPVLGALALVSLTALFVAAGRALTIQLVFIATALTLTSAEPAARSISTTLLALLCFLLVISWPTRTLLVAVPAILLAYVCFMTVRGQDTAQAADDAVLTLAPVLGASAFLAALIRNAERADRLHADRLRAEVEVSFESAVRAARSAVHQLLHDHVLVALNEVADLAPGRRQHVRVLCARTADQIEGSAASADDGGQTVKSVVLEAARSLGVDAHLTLPFQAANDVLAPEVALALSRAAGEALRNITRHSGTRSAEVRYEPGPESASLVISDTGHGTDDLSPGWGISHSIKDPMRAIGGGAHVHSRQGRGTRVALTWPTGQPSAGRERSLDRSFAETQLAVGEVPVLVLVVLPLLLSNLYIAIRYSVHDVAAAAQIALALTSALATYAFVSRFLESGPRIHLVGAVVGADLVTTTVGIALAGGGTTLVGYDSWSIGLAAVGPFALGFYLPVRWWPVVGAPQFIVVVALAETTPGVGITHALGAVNAALLPAYAFACGAALRVGERRLAAELALLATTTRRVDALHASEGARRQVAFLALHVAPFLRHVANGEHSLADEWTSQQARLVSLEARDSLTVGTSLDDALRTRITAARSAGTLVTIVPGNPDARHELPLRLLDRVLDSAACHRAVVLYLTERDEFMLSTTPEIHPAALEVVLRCLSTCEHDVEQDGLSTTITVRPLHPIG